MSLEKWLEYGWLRREPSSANEIKALQGIVRRSLDDAKVEAISADLRFVAAFTAALTAATIALRAAGYRTVTQTGHHTKVIESLELTIHADPKLIQKLKVFSNKRNKSIYDVAGAVSDQELKEVVKLADELHGQVSSWLRKSHPELLKG
ncbi:MAG TPA: hypothetical protein VJW55_04655 [Candidatus Angelobacter sp.]|nr:hypothetical protein [Candidatus Angelobacter sp.]